MLLIMDMSGFSPHFLHWELGQGSGLQQGYDASFCPCGLTRREIACRLGDALPALMPSRSSGPLAAAPPGAPSSAPSLLS